jgi:hypoxanthine phosphoribosyltransferase
MRDRSISRRHSSSANPKVPVNPLIPKNLPITPFFPRFGRKADESPRPNCLRLKNLHHPHKKNVVAHHACAILAPNRKGATVDRLRQVITTDQIQKRVKELGRQISDDYKGQTVQVLAVLENAFMFLADLVRAMDVPVICQFIKPKYTRPQSGAGQDVMEIFFSHEPEIHGRHLLLVEGLVHSGVTSEFLMNDLRARGAASVKLVTLLDRQAARRVQLQPDYFGFLVDETFLVGYGLGAPDQINRNLSYVAAAR